ncbi:MAG: hypothetical protein ACJ789_04960 [Thermomicrobiales bacterium]
MLDTSRWVARVTGAASGHGKTTATCFIGAGFAIVALELRRYSGLAEGGSDGNWIAIM